MHLDVIARLKFVQKDPTEVGQTAPDSRTVSGFTRAGVIWESVLTMTRPDLHLHHSSHQKRCLHLIHRLRKAGLPTPPLNAFYRGIIKAFSQTASLPGSEAAEEQQQLNRTVKTASQIIWCSSALPDGELSAALHPQGYRHQLRSSLPSQQLYALLPQLNTARNMAWTRIWKLQANTNAYLSQTVVKCLLNAGNEWLFPFKYFINLLF